MNIGTQEGAAAAVDAIRAAINYVSDVRGQLIGGCLVSSRCTAGTLTQVLQVAEVYHLHVVAVFGLEHMRPRIISRATSTSA